MATLSGDAAEGTDADERRTMLGSGSNAETPASENARTDIALDIAASTMPSTPLPMPSSIGLRTHHLMPGIVHAGSLCRHGFWKGKPPLAISSGMQAVPRRVSLNAQAGDFKALAAS